MDLNPINIEEATKERMKGETKPTWEEVDEANALAVMQTRDDVLAWRARLQLLQWWKEALLAQILQVLCAAGGLGLVAVHLLQPRLFICRLLLATRPLGYHPGLLLAHGGGGVKFCGVQQWCACVRKRKRVKEIGENELRVKVKKGNSENI